MLLEILESSMWNNEVLKMANEKDQLLKKRQLIYFGAPGTGKSTELNNRAKECFGENITRVTFHPSYTYAHFFGSYKPVSDDSGKKIEYRFIPGPFMNTLIKALTETAVDSSGEPKKHLLLIEEINRANPAAVFGDVFQLLDRDKNGESIFPVETSEEVKRYMTKNVAVSLDSSSLKIPKNMYIWATMNSADQGVFPMDTAFKRRWNFKYMNLDIDSQKDVKLDSGETVDDNQVTDTKSIKKALVPFFEVATNKTTFTWEKFRNTTNETLKALGVNEDKCLGPFFINAQELLEIQNHISLTEKIDDSKDEIKDFQESFCNKVLMYLYEDAAKNCRPKFFSCEKNNGGRAVIPFFSEVKKKFITEGISVFGDEWNSQWKKQL